MKYYFDTEFHEYAKPFYDYDGTIWESPKIENHTVSLTVPTIDLISIGIVKDNGEEYYAVSKDFDLNAAAKHDWLPNNAHNALEDAKWNKAVHEWILNKDMDIPIDMGWM